LILLLLLQLTINDAIEAYNQGQYERAQNIAFQIELDTTDSFQYYEVLELRAYTSTSVREFDKADSLFQLVFEASYKSILAKAYVDYAELQHLQFNFDRRLTYLKKAYELEQRAQTVRIIARHYFQVEADFEKAQEWIDKHPVVMDPKEQAGFNLLLAEFNESKRKYELAIRYYSMAKINAQQANLFSYELFASKGLYRSNRILEAQKQENMINLISWLILSLIGYYIYKHKNYVSAILGKDSGGT